MPVRSLGYAGFEVSNLAEWSEFATGVLGLMPAAGGDGARLFRADAQAWRVALHEGASDDLAYVGLEVAGPQELDAIRRRLSDAGVAVAEPDAALRDARGVSGLICCRDPDGLMIELYFGPTEVNDQPFRSPAGVSGFVTDQQGLGHIVLATPNIVAARAFYRDALGFSLSDVIRMRIGPTLSFDLEFYHCNARHHTVALAPTRARKRLHHFMLQARTLDEVGFALDRACAAGVHVTQGLGRHTNDQMVSFYAATPSGFEVEFGCGGLEISDATWRVTRHDAPSSWGHKRLPAPAARAGA